ncbi:MAG: hypothetical protein NZ823_09135, partial [Blastocatellia bacterium]|nr:hypothetical protein [Blastocatellia bacterium]
EPTSILYNRPGKDYAGGHSEPPVQPHHRTNIHTLTISQGKTFFVKLKSMATPERMNGNARSSRGICSHNDFQMAAQAQKPVRSGQHERQEGTRK